MPLNVTLEITLRCNLRCVHCYNFDRDLPYLPGRRREEELSDAEIFRILDEVREAGCLYLSLTGGEALVHPRVYDFCAHASAAGMMVTVKTNGLLLDEEAVARLVAAEAAGVEVSVYGAEHATHDAFVQAPGALARTLDGVRRARAAGLRAKLAFVVGRRNAGEVEAMIALAAELGVPYNVDPQLTARYDGSAEPLDERVGRETLERLYRGPLRHLVPAPVEQVTSVQCACARSVCGISAFGEVYPCIGAPLPSGNLRDRSFAEVWRDSPTLNWIRRLELDDFAACKRCDHVAHCRRSSGVIYTNTGTYNGPVRFGDDWTCLEAEVLHRLHDEQPGAAPQPSAGALKRHSLD